MNVVLLVNKLDWNGVTLRAKPTLKILRFLGIDNINARRVRSFPKVTMGFCRSTGCKDKSFLTLKMISLSGSQTQARRQNISNFQLWQLITLQPLNLQRQIIPLWKDLNLFYIQTMSSKLSSIFILSFAFSKRLISTVPTTGVMTFILGNCL